MFHLHPIYPQNHGFQNATQFFFQKPLRMFWRHFPTYNQVFKVQNVSYFSGNVPFISHLPQNQGFPNVIRFFLKPPKMLYRHFPV
jgi:hypothetical protein